MPKIKYPIWIVDDDPIEGGRVKALLTTHKNAIYCLVGDGQEFQVKYEVNAQSLVGKLKAALGAINRNDVVEFGKAIEEIPAVVVLDQFLPESDGKTQSLSASKEVQRLIAEVWNAVFAKSSYKKSGWNLCVLMYTGQTDLQVSEGLERGANGMDWLGFAQKPLYQTNRTEEELAAEGLQFVQQINGLTSKDIRGLSHEVLIPLYGGEHGRALVSAMNSACAGEKPIWLDADKKDGREAMLQRLLDTTQDVTPVKKDVDGLFVELQKMRTTNSMDGNYIFEIYDLNAATLDFARLKRAVQLLGGIKRRLVVVAPCIPDQNTIEIFNLVSVEPLYEWTINDIQICFGGLFNGRKLNKDAAQRIKTMKISYDVMESWYFDGVGEITLPAINEKIPSNVTSTTAAVTLKVLSNDKVQIVVNDCSHVISLTKYPEISVVALLLAMKSTRGVKIGLENLTQAVKDDMFVGQNKIEKWVVKMETDKFKANYFSTTARNNVRTVLDKIFSNVSFDVKDIKSNKFTLTWKSPSLSFD
jgi:hypothetical protein